MPFLKQIKIPTGVVAFWELTEKSHELQNDFVFSESEKKEFGKIKIERRKTEYLATRLLFQKIVGFKPFVIYSKHGKPSIKNLNKNISISHCAGLVAVIVSENEVGIDIENSHRNIDRVATRFLHTDELCFISEHKNAQQLKVLFWSAKEAIFKCSIENGIQFDRQIIIPPFDVKNQGDFRGELLINDNCYSYHLWYFYIGNTIVVYCVDEDS